MAINYFSKADLENNERLIFRVVQQLTFLEDQLKRHNLGYRMQSKFPEGYIFIYALYGLTWIKIAQHSKANEELKSKALQEAHSAYEFIITEEIKQDFPADVKPAYGIFYRGWSNYLLGQILSLSCSPDSELIAAFSTNCKDIAKAISDTLTPFPASYEQSCWPADAVVSVASLKLHDQLFMVQYDSIIAHWVSRIKKKLDPKYGMIPHSANAMDGSGLEGPRGSSMSLMLIFLHEIDADFAVEQYSLFRKHFEIYRLTFPAVREFALGESVKADLDSGPILWDVSFPGSIVSIGVTKKFGDYRLANRLSRTVDAYGMPFHLGGRYSYLFGYQPMADAFIAWARMQ
ncbi:MAG: hypothetical protein ABIQ02_11005 [Saprospiraceae bacterium]